MQMNAALGNTAPTAGSKNVFLGFVSLSMTQNAPQLVLDLDGVRGEKNLVLQPEKVALSVCGCLVGLA